MTGGAKKVDLERIYRVLMERFGEQGWWPTTREGEVKPKHEGRRPESEREKLEIIVGAILTQNTSWKNVERAIENLNRRGLIDVEKLMEIDEEDLAEVVKPSGYYRQKAKRLKDFVRFLYREFGGSVERLFSLDTERLREVLLGIKGIGKETADSIILYAALRPIFVIDAYTTRIMERVGVGRMGYDDLQKMFMDSLPHEQKMFAEYHALLVKLGKEYCRKRNPRCEECPLVEMCEYGKKKRVSTKNR